MNQMLVLSKSHLFEKSLNKRIQEKTSVNLFEYYISICTYFVVVNVN